ncbi:P-loop NTPase family protein [Leptothoe kymatousa]|uniref:ABC transporter domain-containing protein n=1 Tax=Leptothoe kymatousa TAU-MAC 1615 TaxID=2364775 RepID=A0ABS5Y322_9CYAN|nr:hypothetical protein [Leptothoe kymatousa]MBT9311908.1 hypothetical protein [Leptothoe kymatousa TAU-MAC 1615]
MEIPFSVRYNNIKLQVERLYKASNQTNKRLFSGLEDISFSMQGGECIHLKSYVPWASQLLLDTLMGRTQIEAGEIWIQHQERWLNMLQLSQRQMNQVHAQTIGYLQPCEILRSQPTVLDCVLNKFLALGMSRSEADAESRHVLDWVSLPRSLWHKSPKDLSLDELHQVNLASTFAVDYSIIVIGLPISQLDPTNQMRLLELIDYRKTKGTCFIGRFDQAHLRARVCDRSIAIQVPTPISAARPRRTVRPSARRTDMPVGTPTGTPTGAAAGNIAARSY